MRDPPRFLWSAPEARWRNEHKSDLTLRSVRAVPHLTDLLVYVLTLKRPNQILSCCQMKRSLALLPLVLRLTSALAQQSPDTLYGPLFQNVQMHEVFPDQKAFVDCVPTRKPSEIMADYQRLVKEPGFDLKAFVASNFTRPADPDDVTTHIKKLWRVRVGILPTTQMGVPYCPCPTRTSFLAVVSARFITGTLTLPCWD